MNFVRLILIILICVPVFLTWMDWRDYPFSDYGWGNSLSHTNAVITSAELKPMQRKGRARYELVVRYRYEVNGISHHGSMVNLDRNLRFLSDEDATLASQKYKIGSTKVVYYSAKNPQFVLLNKDFPWGRFKDTMITGVIFGIAFFFASLAFYDQKRKSNK